jgi:hypothetical protein
MPSPYKLLQGTRANLALLSSVGKVGILAYTTDTNEVFVGTGSGTGIGTGWKPIGSTLSVANVALAPTAGGKFTVAHSLSVAPLAVSVQMATTGTSTTDDRIWLQSPTGFDATDIYLVASNGGIIGTAICFYLSGV